MRIIGLLLSFFLLVSPIAKSQEGLPFVTEIDYSRQFHDWKINSIVQDAEENMFFSTSRGILKYDGSTWERISTPSPALTVHYHSSSGRLFVGLKRGTLEVFKTDSGTYETKPIAGIDSEEQISRVLSTEGELYFIGESEVFRYEPITQSDAEKFEYSDKLISGAFISDASLYLLFYQEGLFKWRDGVLETIHAFEWVEDEQIIFSFNAKQGTYIGFENDEVHYFDGTEAKAIKGNLAKYLTENILSDGIKLNDTLLAFSTLAGGAIVVNAENNAILHRFDYTTGLKDNEIFCLGSDKDQGLWMAYEVGLSRIDLVEPVKSYSGFPGLEGTLTASIVANGKLHVATGNGVYILKEAKNSAEMQQIMQDLKRKQKEELENRKANWVPPVSANPTKQAKKSKSLIERYKENPEEVKNELTKKELRALKKQIRQLKRQRNKKPGILDGVFRSDDQQEDEPIAPTKEKKISGPDPMKGLTPTPTTGASGSGMTAPPGSGGTKRTAPQILSQVKKKQENKTEAAAKSYLFKKVKGMDVKCRQLISLNNEVFAATNNGLYQIIGESATNLTPGQYINQMYKTSDGIGVLAATLKGALRLKKTGNGWEAKMVNDSVEYVAYNIVEGDDGSIWAGTDDGAYRHQANSSKLYRLPDVMNERVLVAKIYGEIHFLLPTGIFHYIASQDTVMPANLPEVPSSDRLDYLLGNNGIVWVQSDYGWHVLNGDEHISLLPYLELFEDIRDLIIDAKGNLYIIDGGKALYSVLERKEKSDQKFNIYIRQVVGTTNQVFSLEQISVGADQSSLRFNVSAPFYVKSDGTKYQYRIEGLQDSWTSWKPESVIEPGFLPPGDYVLQVRAKNVLGEVSDMKTLAFVVEKPMWQRWYFLLVYFLVLTLIIFGVIKWRERSLKEEQRVLEEMVHARTIDLENEKEKVEGLLLNILPKETAQELQVNGKATPRHYNQVSVLFTDFKGFTQFAENTTPQALVTELDRCFIKFDEIIEKYKLEKIKTIGDSYMCAGGVPNKNASNPISTALAAIEIRDFMEELAEEKNSMKEEHWEVRIGIHTGPLTAGVVGKKKFAYDIWGDTVNTASRMESTSVPGHINISAATHELIKNYFECVPRGKKDAKGKGLVEMYFITGIKPNYSVNGKGKIPNDELWNVIG